MFTILQYENNKASFGIDPTMHHLTSMYINHAKRPNLRKKVRFDPVTGEGSMHLVAARNIIAGEQLFWDYGAQERAFTGSDDAWGELRMVSVTVTIL